MAGSRIVKVFCDTAETRELAAVHECIESYGAFSIFAVTPRVRDALGKQYPTEDLTDAFRIRVGKRRIDTRKARIASDGSKKPHPFYRGIRDPGPGRHHYLVQFIGPIKPAWLRRIKKAGGEVRAPYDDFTFVVRCGARARTRIAGDSKVRWMGHLPHDARIEIAKRSLPRTKGISGVYNIEFFDGGDLKRARGAVKRAGATILDADPKAGILTIRIEGGERVAKRCIDKISAIHGVRTLRPRTFRRTSNNVALPILGGDTDISAPAGLSGAGETIAICDTGLDTGDAANLHPDFTGRLKAIRSYPIQASFRPFIRNPGADDGPADLDSGHGTHVAGSALGSGEASRGLTGIKRIRGFAPDAELVFQAVEQQLDWKNPADSAQLGRFVLAGLPDDLRPLFRWAHRRGARVHSNSWGGGAPGEYDAHCEQLDEFVWKHKDFCILVAAGNDGTDAQGSLGGGDGVINATSVTSPGTAKNCITVGASENERPEFSRERYGEWWPHDYPVSPYKNAAMANRRNQIVAFSSRGPTLDGRTKPEVVAPGTFVLSTRARTLSSTQHGWAPFPADRHYFHMGGTSMATPLVAGAVATLREFFRTWLDFSTPSAALLKAALLLGADAQRLPRGEGEPRRGPMDNAQGFGRVNLRNIVKEGPGRAVYFLDDDAGLRTGGADRFDLRVRSGRHPLRIAMAYSDFPGPRLVNNLNLLLRDPRGRRFVGNGARRGDLGFDNTNNAEVIHITRPAVGEWRLDVVGSNVPHGPQDYAIAAAGDIRF